MRRSTKPKGEPLNDMAVLTSMAKTMMPKVPFLERDEIISELWIRQSSGHRLDAKARARFAIDLYRKYEHRHRRSFSNATSCLCLEDGDFLNNAGILNKSFSVCPWEEDQALVIYDYMTYLTPEERQLCYELFEGVMQKEIGKRRGISESRISQMFANIALTLSGQLEKKN